MNIHQLSCSALLALAMVSSPAMARIELGGGVVNDIRGHWGQVLVISWINGQRWQRELSTGHLARPNGAFERRRQNTSYVAAGLRYPLRDSGFFVGGALALVERETEALTSRGQFISSLGWSTSHWTLSLRHISNADTGGRNRGEDLLTLSYAW